MSNPYLPVVRVDAPAIDVQVSTPYVGIPRMGLPAPQPRSVFDDPFALVSLSDVIFNRAGRLLANDFQRRPWMPTTIVAGAKYIQNQYLAPLQERDYTTLLTNTFQALARDVDVFSSPMKRAVMTSENPELNLISGVVVGGLATAGLIASGGAIAPAVLAGIGLGGAGAVASAVVQDPKAAVQGMIDGIGMGSAGKHYAYFDTGSMAVNIIGEMALDPLNWVSFGLAGVTDVAIRNKIRAIEGLDPKAVSKAAKTIKEYIRSGDSKALQLSLERLSKNPQVSQALWTTVMDDVGFNVVRGLGRTVQTTDQLQKFILKSATWVSPLAAVKLGWTGGKKALVLANKLVQQALPYVRPQQAYNQKIIEDFMNVVNDTLQRETRANYMRLSPEASDMFETLKKLNSVEGIDKTLMEFEDFFRTIQLEAGFDAAKDELYKLITEGYQIVTPSDTRVSIAALMAIPINRSYLADTDAITREVIDFIMDSVTQRVVAIDELFEVVKANINHTTRYLQHPAIHNLITDKNTSPLAVLQAVVQHLSLDHRGFNIKSYYDTLLPHFTKGEADNLLARAQVEDLAALARALGFGDILLNEQDRFLFEQAIELLAMAERVGMSIEDFINPKNMADAYDVVMKDIAPFAQELDRFNILRNHLTDLHKPLSELQYDLDAKATDTLHQIFNKLGHKIVKDVGTQEAASLLDNLARLKSTDAKILALNNYRQQRWELIAPFKRMQSMMEILWKQVEEAERLHRYYEANDAPRAAKGQLRKLKLANQRSTELRAEMKRLGPRARYAEKQLALYDAVEKQLRNNSLIETYSKQRIDSERLHLWVRMEGAYSPYYDLELYTNHVSTRKEAFDNAIQLYASNYGATEVDALTSLDGRGVDFVERILRDIDVALQPNVEEHMTYTARKVYAARKPMVSTAKKLNQIVHHKVTEKNMTVQDLLSTMRLPDETVARAFDDLDQAANISSWLHRQRKDTLATKLKRTTTPEASEAQQQLQTQINKTLSQAHTEIQLFQSGGFSPKDIAELEFILGGAYVDFSKTVTDLLALDVSTPQGITEALEYLDDLHRIIRTAMTHEDSGARQAIQALVDNLRPASGRGVALQTKGVAEVRGEVAADLYNYFKDYVKDPQALAKSLQFQTKEDLLKTIDRLFAQHPNTDLEFKQLLIDNLNQGTHKALLDLTRTNLNAEVGGLSDNVIRLFQGLDNLTSQFNIEAIDSLILDFSNINEPVYRLMWNRTGARLHMLQTLSEDSINLLWDVNNPETAIGKLFDALVNVPLEGTGLSLDQSIGALQRRSKSTTNYITLRDKLFNYTEGQLKALQTEEYTAVQQKLKEHKRILKEAQSQNAVEAIKQQEQFIRETEEVLTTMSETFRNNLTDANPTAVATQVEHIVLNELEQFSRSYTGPVTDLLAEYAADGQLYIMPKIKTRIQAVLSKSYNASTTNTIMHNLYRPDMVKTIEGIIWEYVQAQAPTQQRLISTVDGKFTDLLHWIAVDLETVKAKLDYSTKRLLNPTSRETKEALATRYLQFTKKANQYDIPRMTDADLDMWIERAKQNTNFLEQLNTDVYARQELTEIVNKFQKDIKSDLRTSMASIKKYNINHRYDILTESELKAKYGMNAGELIDFSTFYAYKKIYAPVNIEHQRYWDRFPHLSDIGKFKLEEAMKQHKEIFSLGYLSNYSQTLPDGTKARLIDTTTLDAYTRRTVEIVNRMVENEAPYSRAIQRLGDIMSDPTIPELDKIAIAQMYRNYNLVKIIDPTLSYKEYQRAAYYLKELRKANLSLDVRVEEALQSRYKIQTLKDIMTDPNKILNDEMYWGALEDAISATGLSMQQFNELIDMATEGWSRRVKSEGALINQTTAIQEYIKQNKISIQDLKKIREAALRLDKQISKGDVSFSHELGKMIHTRRLGLITNMGPEDLARHIKYDTPGAIVILKEELPEGIVTRFTQGELKTALKSYGIEVFDNDLGLLVYKSKESHSEAYNALQKISERKALNVQDSVSLGDRLPQLLDERYRLMERQRKWTDGIFPFEDKAILPELLNSEKMTSFREWYGDLVDKIDLTDFPVGYDLDFMFFAHSPEVYTKYIPYTSPNPIKGLISSSVSLSKTAEAKVKYIDMFFNKDFEINAMPFIKEMSDGELFNFMKRHKHNYRFARLVQGSNGDPIVKQLFVTNAKQIGEFRNLDQVVLLPLDIFNGAYSVINNYKNLVRGMPLLSLWSKLVINSYQSMYLATAGFPVRNALDSIVKNTAEGKTWEALPESIQNMGKGFMLYKRYNEIQREVLLRSGGDFNSRTLVKYLMDLPREDRIMYAFTDQIITSSAGGSQISAYAKQLRSFNIEQRRLHEDSNDSLNKLTEAVGWMQFENPFIEKVFSVSAYVENMSRIGMVLNQTGRSRTITEGINQAIFAHFNYDMKSKAEVIAELFIPFVTFPYRNLMFWIDKAFDNPALMRSMLDLQQQSWETGDRDWYGDAAKYTGMRYHTTAGNIRIEDLIIKANPSMYDAMRLAVAPQQEIANRLIAPIQYGLSQFTDKPQERMGLPWDGHVRNLDKILHGDKFRDGARGLDTFVPSLFSRVYNFENQWRNTGRPWEYGFPNSRRYYHKMIYPPRFSTYNFYSRLYSKAGNSRLALRMSRNTSRNLAYKVYDIQARFFTPRM